MAPVDLKEMEVRRVTDLVKGLGYSVIRTEYRNDRAVISLEKVFETGTVDMLRGDMDRLSNMLKQFQWSMVTSSISGLKASAEFEKRVTGEV